MPPCVPRSSVWSTFTKVSGQQIGDTGVKGWVGCRENFTVPQRIPAECLSVRGVGSEGDGVIDQRETSGVLGSAVSDFNTPSGSGSGSLAPHLTMGLTVPLWTGFSVALRVVWLGPWSPGGVRDSTKKILEDSRYPLSRPGVGSGVKRLRPRNSTSRTAPQ